MDKKSIRRRTVKTWALLWKSSLDLIRDGGIELSGYIAFTSLLSLFPMLIFGAALMGLLSDSDTIKALIQQLFSLIPTEVEKVILPVLIEILGQEKHGLLSLGLLGTLWAASSGIEALRLGLNRAYGLRETRSFFWRRFQGMLIVSTLGLGMALLTVVIVLEPILQELAKQYLDWAFLKNLDQLWNLLRYGSATFVLFILLNLVYQKLPNHHRVHPHSYVGAAIATLLWLIAASLFSLYMAYAGNYTVTYGSLGGIIITLLFFQITALVFLFGGEINQVLNAQDKTGQLPPLKKKEKASG